MNLIWINKRIIGWGISGIMFFMITGVKAEMNSGIYLERVYLNAGPDIYVAGERIWYTANCFSNASPDGKVFSKVLYVELIDHKKQHVMGQILKIKDGRSLSVMQLPDTLATGLYFLKAYTNWMKNFEENNFSSTPVFIYNNYDERNNTGVIKYKYYAEPEVYIQGGRLVHNIPCSVQIYIPGLFGREIAGRLVKIPEEDSISTEVLFDQTGMATFSLLPESGSTYSIVCKDQSGETFQINLPVVLTSGYSLKVKQVSTEFLTVRVNTCRVYDEVVFLKVLQKNRVVYRKEIERSVFGDEIRVPLSNLHNGAGFNLVLENDKGAGLTSLALLFSGSNYLDISSLPDRVNSNEKNSFGISFHGPENLCSGRFIMDIYKKETGVTSEYFAGIFNDFENKYLVRNINSGMQVLSPFVRTMSSGKGIYDNSIPEKIDYPVEDMGILVTGKVIPDSGLPFPDGTEAILFIKDTIPDIQSSRLNSNGDFAFLIRKYRDIQGEIELFHRLERLNDNYKVILDKKFYFSGGNDMPGMMTQSLSEEYNDLIENEAQRVLIQRVFDNFNSGRFDSLTNIPYSQEAFYGNPTLVVYPSQYFFLPNFSEISREILPRLRYRRDKSGCRIMVTHVENGVKSETPVVLLDGLFVHNLCDLHLLNSDHIQRVEIQSGYRIVGNFLYNGLVAIYTSGDYRLKNNDYGIESSLNIPGFSYVPDFSVVYNTSDHKKGQYPDFRNRLYWNPEFDLMKGKDVKVEFCTSDELNEYIVEISGFTRDGYPLSKKETFFVAQ
ncbi:MAG: hypothetical protein PVF73_00585 [Bacteroidales bacterium]|jgi:hypothetical protein